MEKKKPAEYESAGLPMRERFLFCPISRERERSNYPFKEPGSTRIGILKVLLRNRIVIDCEAYMFLPVCLPNHFDKNLLREIIELLVGNPSVFRQLATDAWPARTDFHTTVRFPFRHQKCKGDF